MAENIFIVTHGEKEAGADPGLTAKGKREATALRSLLPTKPPAVICGTGNRHVDMAIALDMDVTRFTATIGGPDSMEVVDGAKVILLASGTVVNPKAYTTLEDNAEATKKLVVNLPDQSVILAGRPALMMLGLKEAKSATVYRLEVYDGGIHLITEVVATGVSEAGTV